MELFIKTVAYGGSYISTTSQIQIKGEGGTTVTSGSDGSITVKTTIPQITIMRAKEHGPIIDGNIGGSFSYISSISSVAHNILYTVANTQITPPEAFYKFFTFNDYCIVEIDPAKSINDEVDREHTLVILRIIGNVNEKNTLSGHQTINAIITADVNLNSNRISNVDFKNYGKGFVASFASYNNNIYVCLANFNNDTQFTKTLGFFANIKNSTYGEDYRDSDYTNNFNNINSVSNISTLLPNNVIFKKFDRTDYLNNRECTWWGQSPYYLHDADHEDSWQVSGDMSSVGNISFQNASSIIGSATTPARTAYVAYTYSSYTYTDFIMPRDNSYTTYILSYGLWIKNSKNMNSGRINFGDNNEAWIGDERIDTSTGLPQGIERVGLTMYGQSHVNIGSKGGEIELTTKSTSGVQATTYLHPNYMFTYINKNLSYIYGTSFNLGTGYWKIATITILKNNIKYPLRFEFEGSEFGHTEIELKFNDLETILTVVKYFTSTSGNKFYITSAGYNLLNNNNWILFAKYSANSSFKLKKYEYFVDEVSVTLNMINVSTSGFSGREQFLQVKPKYSWDLLTQYNIYGGSLSQVNQVTNWYTETSFNLLNNVSNISQSFSLISSDGSIQFKGKHSDVSLAIDYVPQTYVDIKANCKISVGDYSTSTNTETTNSNTYLRFHNGANLQDKINIVGGTGINVSSTNGQLTIKSTVTNTDTKTTAGATNSTSKLFLIGATAQTANPVTNSNINCYIENGTLTTTKINTGDVANMWIIGKTDAAIKYNNLTEITTNKWHSFFGIKSSSGNVVNFGGLGNVIGFHNYLSGRTDNGFDHSFKLNTTNGRWSIKADGQDGTIPVSTGTASSKGPVYNIQVVSSSQYSSSSKDANTLYLVVD